MAKKSPNTLPPKFPLGYDTRATFLDVANKQRGGIGQSKQAKGVLDMLRLRASTQPGVNGDIALRFLRSTVHATHSDLLADAGYAQSERPVQTVQWKGNDYYIGGEYTARPGRRGPIEACVRFGSNEQGQDVKSLRGYQELRCTVALAVGFLVASRELRGDPANAQFEMRVVDNFQIPGPLDQTVYMADSFSVLTQKLIAG